MHHSDISNKRKRRQAGSSRMDNPETLATLDTGNGTKTNKTKHTAQKAKKISNTDPIKNSECTQAPTKDKQ